MPTDAELDAMIAAATGKAQQFFSKVGENGTEEDWESFRQQHGKKVVKKVVKTVEKKVTVTQKKAPKEQPTKVVYEDRYETRYHEIPAEKYESGSNPADIFSAAAREARRFDHERYEARLREMGKAPPSSQELEEREEQRRLNYELRQEAKKQ
ncbi:hypothetical protein J8273_4742 [Carpediemonas membranifera]|uniref:Uncharacterized protein n=1 Tax=Carpediemonas membranifera TaxID=201153 RepID=A0A8J6E1T9_9EUKA|nr:hypothetical protein J8273_4742 [Carpediemonas membranifera]|eukprot:KAG9393878.1 hypothetical protein J8273_4742 [Carpediemonas membranifera]